MTLKRSWVGPFAAAETAVRVTFWTAKWYDIILLLNALPIDASQGAHSKIKMA